MEFNHDMIKKEPLYKEETIRHAARLDEEERRATIKKEKEEQEKSKKLIILSIIGIASFAFIYFYFLKPLIELFK